MNTLKQFLSFATNIFQLVGFSQEEIKKNVHEVLLLLLQTTTVDKLEQYSQEERKNIMQALQSTSDVKELENILESVFVDDSYEKLLQRNGRKILFGIAKQIMKDLDSAQLEELEKLLLSVSKKFAMQ